MNQALAHELQNQFVMVQWLTGPGDMARRLGRLEEAETEYREVIRLSTLHGIDVKREHAEAQLAAVLVDLGKHDEARAFRQSGRDGIASRNDNDSLKGADRKMSNALRRAGFDH